jgi:alpha-1,6-mannosyltransferase
VRAHTSATVWIGLTGVLAAGALVAIGAAHTASLLPESIRPAPPWLQGAFAPIHLDLHVGGTTAVLALMFASYALVVQRADQTDARTLISAIVVLHLFVLLAPPLVSTDLFSYQAYARMGAHYGVNPYLNGPDAIRLDRVFPYVGAKWSSIPSAYGPVFTLGSYLLAPLTVAASVVAYKSIAAAASLGLVALVWRCARLRRIDPVRAIALVGLNPLLVVYGVGGGHNDLLMLLALAAALAMLLSGREAAGGALSVLAVGIKLTAGLVLPFALADRGSRRGVRGRRELVLGCLIGVCLLAALSVAFFGSGTPHLFSTVDQAQREGDWLSISGAIREKLGLQTVGLVVGDALIAGFLLACAWLLAGVWRGAIDWIAAAGWATVAMLVASSSLLPWYVGWTLPLAALGRDRRLRMAVLGLTGVVQGLELLGSIPHG